MITDEQIKAAILLKLYKRGNWGRSHTAFDNLKKGFKAKELGKDGLKRVNRMGRELIRKVYSWRNQLIMGCRYPLTLERVEP